MTGNQTNTARKRLNGVMDAAIKRALNTSPKPRREIVGNGKRVKEGGKGSS
jgi:hypothetical protein